MEGPGPATSVPLSSFLRKLFRLGFVSSFRDESLENLIVSVFHAPDQPPEPIRLTQLYPFSTTMDLKTAIYMTKGRDPNYHPQYQSVLIPTPLDAGQQEAMSDFYIPLDFVWVKPGGSMSRDIYVLPNPFEALGAAEPDMRFVTAAGGIKAVDQPARDRVTLEDLLLKQYGSADPILHVYLYKDLLPKLAPELRTSEGQWYGRLGMFFPDLRPTSPLVPGPAQIDAMQPRVTYLTKQLQLLNHIETVLEEGAALLPIQLAGIRYLRLAWTDIPENMPSIENLFYELKVTQTRPFLRLLPDEGTPVSKVRLASVLKIPDISDPRLLLQWAEEKNPFPEHDYMFAKIVIRKTFSNQPALYGTLRILPDGGADFTLLPPKQLRKLDPRSDLTDLDSLLTQGLADTPYFNLAPNIADGTLICGLRLPQEQKAMTRQSLRRRLAAVAPFFTEIRPIPGENPLVMLRYKAVSNYAKQDDVYTFLTQLQSRGILKGEGAGPQYIDAVQTEFQFDREYSTKVVRDWLAQADQVVPAVPEEHDFYQKASPGIDIAIFAQHPFYSFHIYRVNSLDVLERIYTALSLIFSLTEEQLGASPRTARAFGEAEDEVVTHVGPPPAGAASGFTPEEEELDAAAPATAFAQGAAAEAAAIDPFEEYDFGAEFEDEVEDDAMETAALRASAAVAPAANVADRMRAAAVPAGRNIERAVPQAVGSMGAAASAAAAAAAANNEDESEDEEETRTGKKSYAKWLARKLQEADRALFEYSAPSPAVKVKKYVRKCQATEIRQPAVLNQDQFDRMKSEYADDNVYFTVYPLDQDEPPAPIGSESYTLLRYGTDPRNLNYYLCSEFFCIKDYILVRATDFYSTKDRKGKAKVGETAPGKKDRGSCPFCHGLEIKNMKSPGPSETVIHRKLKTVSKGSKRHLYIGFMRDSPHPKGFALPCCFLDDKILRISDPEFMHIRAASQAEAPPEEEEELVAAVGDAPFPLLDYRITIERVHTKYIVGPEKFPLKLGGKEGPQIGLLLPQLDIYFGQNPDMLVSREANRMELKEDSKGFLRIGVENRSQYLADSFFAAVAPFMDMNSVSQVKDQILKNITPRVFTYLNFGNMLLEFYDPTDAAAPENMLKTWATSELGIETTANNVSALQRIWKSYHRFEAFVRDTQTLKEYRQFAQAFALPGLLTSRGVLFIVLAMQEDGTLKVECPSFGFNPDQFSAEGRPEPDIAFLMHHYSGVWEPIFYTENRPRTSRFPERHSPMLSFPRDNEARWPQIVRNRVREFFTQCSSSGRAPFTSQSGINPLALVPLGKAIQAMGISPSGFIRDAYNHIVGLTFRAARGSVTLPIVDDGTQILPFKMFLDWDDVTAAPMDEVIRFYEREFDTTFRLYNGYRIARRVRTRADGEFVALQLANGIFIPIDPTADTTVGAQYPIVEQDIMEWAINRQIALEGAEADRPEIAFQAGEADFQEIFQHLRLTFANWIGSEDAGEGLRKEIKKIIMNRQLPLFEKRKRMDILLGTTLLSWMDSELPLRGEITTLLRADCRLKAQPVCTGRCVWRQGASAAAPGQCLLHVPQTVGTRPINGPEILKWRLIEELLRFPSRRDELLNKGVHALTKLYSAVQIEDQYILPETSLEWFDLLRLDWVPSRQEKKLFYEEMSRSPEAVLNEPAAAAAAAPILPGPLMLVLGVDDPKSRRLYLIRSTATAGGAGIPPLLPYLQLLGTGPEEIGLEETAAALTDASILALVKQIRRPVIQLDLRTEPVGILSYDVSKYQKGISPIIFVIGNDGPAFLSSSPEYLAAIMPEQMPAGLLEIYTDRALVSVNAPRRP